jgi:hypothetical protein
MGRDERLVRWRLVLGRSADVLDGRCGMSADDVAADDSLGWLYERGDELEEREIAPRGTGMGSSDKLSVPDWLNHVHKLFPQETIERMERDAVEKYQIHEVVTNPEVLKRIEPNETLLRAVLLTKHLMNPTVLALARELVAKVIRKLMEKMARKVKQTFHGTRTRRRSRIRISKNFDPKSTIRKNLGSFDLKTRRLFIKEPLFISRTKRNMENWKLILLVDESGSMIGSVIHTAVTAACLWGLPGLKTHLCIWDTEVVDLTDRITDPVETLMKVQLGGGNDCPKALDYARQLIEAPRRTIVAIISDFYEGATAQGMVARVKSLVDQGTIVLGLCALDEKAYPSYDKDVARALANVGAHVGAMTPGELVNFIAKSLGR